MVGISLALVSPRAGSFTLAVAIVGLGDVLV